MYNILIVDDESVILEGIKEVVMSSSLPFKEIKTASSAAQALSLFQKTPFDIILSDISMPDMDGLAMVEMTRKIWPNTSVIFLTGYQNFDYARKALRLGSSDYLLKPITDEQLIDSLKALLQKLDEVWYRRFYEKEWKKQMDQTILLDQRQYFINGLNHGVELMDQHKLYQLKIPIIVGEKVRSMVVRLDDRDMHRFGEDINDTYYWFLNILQEIFYGRECVCGFQYTKNYWIFVMQSVSEEVIDDAAFYKEIEEMQSYFYEKADTIISIGIQTKKPWKNWQYPVMELIKMVQDNKGLGQLFFVKEEHLSEQDLRENITGIAQKKENSTEIAKKEENPTEFAKKEENPSEIDQKEENCNYFVQKIQKFVKENPKDDLSLSALAARFRINPSYLSRIFHKESGQQLSIFITEVRIEQAKELLLYTDAKIYDVANQVGFETSGYFAKVFNKLVGIPPKEYRITKSVQMKEQE